MPILLNHQLQEQIPHSAAQFPITYYRDELAALPNFAGPFHWHTDFEIAAAAKETLECRIGQQRILLQPGDSLFVNRNVLHSIRQLSGDVPDPMPNIVFSGQLIAPEDSLVYQKYIKPIAECDELPFILFRRDDPSFSAWHQEAALVFSLMEEQPAGYELAVQRALSRMVECIFFHLDTFPKACAARMQIAHQVRLQKMLSYIYENYASPITLEDIARAADISRSEAGRCFQMYLGLPPIRALIQYRLQMAQRLLQEKVLTLHEISFACGFHSVNYFCRQFRKTYGYPPGQSSKLGK